jgi:hypothetical protein
MIKNTQLVIAACMLALSTAHAAETQFDFTGIVTASASIPELPAPGSTFTGSFSFDPTLPADSLSKPNSATFSDFDSGVLIHQSVLNEGSSQALSVWVSGLVTTDGTSITINGYPGDVHGNNVNLYLAAQLSGQNALTLATSFDPTVLPFSGQFIVSSINGNSPQTIPFSITSISAVPELPMAVLWSFGALIGGLALRGKVTK